MLFCYWSIKKAKILNRKHLDSVWYRVLNKFLLSSPPSSGTSLSPTSSCGGDWYDRGERVSCKPFLQALPGKLMVWVRTEFGTPEDGPLWKTEAQRSWLTWLSFFYQRHQSAGPLPQSSRWDCVDSSYIGSDGKSLTGSEASDEGGFVLPISTYATSGELFCGLIFMLLTTTTYCAAF